MEHLIDMELDALKQALLTMASHAETAVNRAVRALQERDHALASQVNDDDVVIDRYEIEIDERAIQLLAKAPLAGDLRFVTVAMKISQNLERVGDEAAKIAKRARDLSGEAPVRVQIDVQPMAALAISMLRDALDAFVRRDAAAAREILPRDRGVNSMNKQFSAVLADHMSNHSSEVKGCLKLMVVVKSLERIADHAKNVAEEVVFLCEAQDIRHASKARFSQGSTR
ncbi:MAG TPA: phosphate signaling complex protein PhoU [Verrucomicrobiae bacterium]|nr:phosphate signaling complex protein PhoU [Verrucomicrobiae bacterium]